MLWPALVKFIASIICFSTVLRTKLSDPSSGHFIWNNRPENIIHLSHQVLYDIKTFTTEALPRRGKFWYFTRLCRVKYQLFQQRGFAECWNSWYRIGPGVINFLSHFLWSQILRGKQNLIRAIKYTSHIKFFVYHSKTRAWPIREKFRTPAEIIFLYIRVYFDGDTQFQS